MAHANLQFLFGTDEPSREYLYDYAHIHTGHNGSLPKQWVTLTNTQVHRLVYMLLHNFVAPHVFMSDIGGGMLKWTYTRMYELESPTFLQSPFKFLVMEHKRSGNEIMIRIAPKGTVCLSVSVSLIGQVVYLELRAMSGSFVIMLSWNSEKRLSISLLEHLTKKLLVKRNQLAKGQRLHVIGSKLSEMQCEADEVWEPCRGIKRRLRNKTHKEDVEFKPSSCLEKFHAVDPEKVNEAVPLQWAPEIPAYDSDTTDSDFSDDAL